MTEEKNNSCALSGLKENIFLAMVAELSDILFENPCVQLKSGEVEKKPYKGWLLTKTSLSFCTDNVQGYLFFFLCHKYFT